MADEVRPLRIRGTNTDGTGVTIEINGLDVGQVCQAADLNLTAQVGTQNSLWVELIGVVPDLAVDEMPLVEMDLDRQQLEAIREIIDVRLQQLDEQEEQP